MTYARTNTIAMILFHFCTICEVKKADNMITFKILSGDKLMKFMQRQLHQSQQVTQLLVTAAVHHVQQFIATLECGPMPNVMAALSNIGGALCSTPQFG